MNKFNQIIEAAVKDASVKPCRLNFTDMRFNARLRAKASGMERYYRAAKLAFRKPRMAKKILQYLLTNLSAMIRNRQRCVKRACSHRKLAPGPKGARRFLCRDAI